MNNKHTKSGRLLATLILWIACFVTLLPLVWLVISSFKTNESFLTSLLVPKSPIVAEGRIHTPAQASAALAAGAHCVVVGTAITHPQSITGWFAAALTSPVPQLP